LTFPLWYLIAGLLLISMALVGTRLERLPLTTSLLYLLAGALLGPHAANLIRLDVVESARLIERVTEFVVIVSLFVAGLKLRVPLSDPRWFLPVRLATVSMLLTVGLVAVVGHCVMGLPLGAAMLLGAILAPTDPVLASDVQVEHPSDRDRLRFSLTGEAGLNDGAAFPFAMLGLGLLGLHDLGSHGWKWVAVDVLWSVAGGLAIGALAGTLVARLVLYLRKTHKEAVGLDEFLALGLIALAYGAAVQLHTYGFLAVFAAGVALRGVEAAHGDEGVPPQDPNPAPADPSEPATEAATHPDKAPAFMARAVLGFNEQLERVCEVAVVVLIGGLLTSRYVAWSALWFVPLLFLAIRPAGVLVGLAGARVTGSQRILICWFGVRGVGSLYYLAYATNHGLDPATARALASLALTTVAASVVLHGISVTPLMKWYESLRRPGRAAAPPSH
jgi:NhaP-type Na+/H+ or K+/H+ antiporter